MKENIRIIINNSKIQIINFLLGGSNSFNNLEVSQDEIINSLDLLNYFDSNLTSYTATSNFTDLVNVSINNTNLDITLVQNAYSFTANSLNQDEVLSFTIPDNYSSDLKYFCYSHSSMIGNFTIEDQPLDISSINTKFYVRLNSDPFSSPYYLFSLTSDGTSLNESSDLVLYRGISYEFEKTDSGHPFNIGSSHNENATGIVVTSNGTGGTVYSETLITVSATDGSTTSSQSFKIKVNQDSEVTGTITFTDNVIINQTITATVNLTDNDGSITLSYQWQVSDDNVTFTNTDTNDTTLSFVIPSDYVGKYIRLQVSSVDSEGGVTVVNSYSREVKDVFGDIQVNTSSSDTVIKLENMNSLDTNNTFDGETSLYYSNFTSSDSNILPTLSSTWDQIGSSIYGEGFADKSGNAVSLSNDGTIIAIGEYNEYADANSDNLGSVRVFELINNVWTQKGSKLFGEKQMDWFGGYKIKLSGDGTKLFVHADRYNIDTNDDTSSNEGKLYIYTFSNNDWLNVNSIEGTSNNHYMLFDASDDGTVFTIANQNENKVIVYNYDYSTDVYSVKGSEITGDSNFGQNVSLSDDGNNICIADNRADYYVYTYDTDNNNWIQKGSTVSSDQGKGNSSLKLNYDGSVFIYGAHYYNSYFVKTIIEGDDVSSVLRNFQNDGYQLKTAYYGTNDGTNLSDGSIYENLNSNKLLNINDYNKVRYDVHTFSGDFDNPDSGYQTTSYSNDIFKFDFDSTDTNHELNDITGYSINVYIKISGFFTPISTGNYRLVFNPTDDGVKIRMREFTTSTDIENDSSSEITLLRRSVSGTDYFKYSVYDFTNDYNTPFDSSNYKNREEFSTMIGWNSDADINTDMNTFFITGSGNEDTYTSNYNTLTGTDTSLIFIKMEVVFSTSTDDEYYFEFFTDDGIRIKIVEFNDAAPNSNTASDWDSLTNIDQSGEYDYETNWEGHPPCIFQYTISLQKYKIYKAYIEYTQGTGGYTFAERIHRSGDSTFRKFEDTFQLYDTDATWDDTNYVWNDRDSFTSGGSRIDIGNIYLDNTKNYEFFIEFAQGGGGGEFNFYAENTDENFTSSPTDISTEFVSLVNLKSKLEILKEDSNNEIISTSPDFNVYDPNSGVDKFTYLVFYKDGYVGKTKVYEYKTDVEGNIDWYQVSNDILGLETNGWGGWRTTLDKSGKQIATVDIRSGDGTVRILKHDPIGTSILNFYGSGIDSVCSILANNERLYQGSRLFSPNGNYQLSFQESDGNFVLYENGNALYGFDTQNNIGDNQTTAYAVMEDGNLNIYDENGDHRYSFTSDSTSGVLALDNNGNLSIVDNWIEWQRFSGGGEQGSSIDFTPDGTVIAIGTKNYEDNIYRQGRTEIFQLNNQLTLASVNSLTTGSSTDISFNVTDGTHTDNKTFTISNIEDSTIGELRIISNTFNLFEGSTLTADISSLYDPDGTISITSYEWEISNSSDFNNYSTITSATNSSFTIPKDTESSFSYVGQYIRLKVVANNTDLFSEPRLVLNIEDEVSGTVSFTSNMSLILEDSILTAVTSISDVDNNKLVVDTNDVGSLNLNYQWQISSDDVTFTNIDTNATSSTYQIPVGTYNGQYIRLLVTSTDRRGGTSNILSTSHLILELNLVTQTNISDSNYFEDNDYTFDLSSIIDTNHDVSFEVKTDDSNGSTTIDTNKLLTFTPNNDYNGVSTLVVTASTDTSLTSITQDITFTLTINPVNDDLTGTISINGINLPNNELSVDLTSIVNVDNDSLTYNYLWQLSFDTNSWDSSTDVATTSTYTIPDNNDNYNKFIRVIVTINDGDTNSEFISNEIQIERLDLVTQFTISDSNYFEDNDYVFDLSSIINSNYDVSFSVKTDDSNGSTIIDSNKLLTFTPNNNYNGTSTIVVTAFTDTSVTLITQDITFTIDIQPVDDKPSGTIIYTDNVIINQTITATVNLSDNDGPLTLGYQWQVSDDNSTFTNTDTNDTTLTFVIPSDYVGKYIRLQVSSVDSEGGVTVVNSYSRQVKDVFGDIQVNTSSDNTVIKLENTYVSLYNSYYAQHHRSDGYENLIFSIDDHDGETFFNDIKYLKNHYITIPDFSGDTFYTFDASVYGGNPDYNQLKLRDKYGNRPEPAQNTYYTFNVYSIFDNSSLLYSNVTSTSLYNSYYAMHHRSDISAHETLMSYSGEGQDLYNYTNDLSNHYITIPDFSGDTVYTFNVFIYGDGTYYGLTLRDPDGNRPSLTTNTYYTFNVYSNVSDSNIVPTITSTWEQIGDAFYGTDSNDNLGSMISLSSDGLVVAFKKGSTVEVYEKINENWTQKGSTIDLVSTIKRINISVDGTKLFAHIYDLTNSNYDNKVILYKYNNASWEKLGAEHEFSNSSSININFSKDCNVFAIGYRLDTYVEVWKLDDDENGFTQYGNTITDTEDIYRFGYDVKLSENGEVLCINNPWGQFVTEVDTNLIGAGFIDVYYYDNGTWTKKGSRIYQEKSMNTVHGFNFDFNVVGNTFSFSNRVGDNYILKMSGESTDASTIISEYENAGYSLHTAYYGNSLDTDNLLNGTIYDSLNDGKLLNINDHNKVRYDIYTITRDSDNNWDYYNGVYQKTEYRNELLSWSGSIGDSETSNLEVLTDTLGDEGIEIEISFFISPVTSDDYKFKFLNNDDTSRLYIVEFGNDIDSGLQTLSSHTTDNAISLDSSKNYEFKIIWGHGHGAFVFQSQVDIGNDGTFVDLYNTNNFTFKSRFEVLKEENTSFTSSQDNYNLSDPHVGIPKYTYYVFKSDAAGSSYIWQYNDRLNEWYQLGNTIYNSPSSLEPENDQSGYITRLNETGKVIAISERYYENGNVKVMQYNPYGTSIANLYGSGINAPNTILSNNEKLYQGSYITSPNQKYILKFTELNAGLSLRYNPDPEDTNTVIETNVLTETDFDNLEQLYFIDVDVHNGTYGAAYIVMEYGNLNVYNLSGEHRYSYTTNAKSGVLSLDDNGNLSIVENWIQNGNNITGFRENDENGNDLSISNDGLTLAVGAPYYDGINNDDVDSGLLRIYNINNVLTLSDVNSLDIGQTIDISIDITDGYGNETKTFTISNIDDTTIGEIRVLSNTIIIYEGTTLTADTTSLTDPDSNINITYQWEISSDSNTYTSITEATNSTFTIPKDTESTESYVGLYIRLKVVANDTEFYSDPKLVINLEDEATGTLSFVSNITSIQEGAILTAVTNISDVDNKKLITDTNDDQPLNLSYQWQISSDNTTFTNIDNATINEYQIPIGTYTDQYIRLFITTTDTRGGTTDFVTTSSLIEVNNSPFFNTSPGLVAYEGQEYEYTFTFSDADSNQTISITNITYPSWISFDSNSNKLSGTPTSNDSNDTNNNNDVSITISDGTNETIQNFTIYVNRAPILENDLNLTFDEDEIINPIDLDLYFTDYDTNDTINYTINSYDTNFLTASIDSDRKLNLVLVNNKFGTSNITITATDGYNSITRTGTITINSVNDDPTGTISIIGTALPNQTLTVDLTQIIDVDDSSFIYTYIWQMSSDSNIWDTSSDVSTSSTYTIPDTNDNENKYIRVKVTIEDSDTNNTEFISNEVQIQKLDLVTSFSINGSTDEDINYTYDLSSIIDTNYDVSFEVKTDDSNGLSIIDTNKLLTFTPDNNYNGSSIIIVAASTDSSVTSITQDITFNLTINSINDQPTGTVSIVGTLLPNNQLSVDLTQITDIENDSLTYTYIWQMSSDSNTWDSSTDLATSSTYLIPDTNDNENYYIRVKVTVEDSDTNNTEFISNEVQIQKLNLVITFNESDTIDEDNSYTFDLSSIIDSNYDVSFEIKTDDSNGTSIIDTNKLLTFTPENNYYGSSSIIITASTDSSVTSITQDITFDITISSINDEPTGTVLIVGNALLNDTLSANLDISDIENDVLQYSYSWEISSEIDNWETSVVVGTESAYTIAEDTNYIGQYIRLVVSIQDSDSNDNKITSSNILEISNVRLLSTNEISETIQEDNNFIYDLNNVKDTNQNVFFSINSVSNGQASIDENDILTFTPDLNYFGNSEIKLDVTTDSSITTMIQSLLLNLSVVSVNDEPTGTISIVGTNLPNEELSIDLSQIFDIENDSLTYTYLWQMSSDSNTWESDVSTSSTYTIPDTNDNENKYIRVKVSVEDSDTNNTEFISNTIQIEKIDLITSFSINNATDEDNDYTFDLSSIIDTNYDVSFEIKTDDVNGSSVIDTNKLLTFTPDNNYNGLSTIIVTASTDTSITSITQDITFNITVNPINDQPTGTVSIVGTLLPNKQLSVDLSNITDVDDSSFLYTYIWQMSSDTNTWDSSTNVATSSTYLIPDTNDNENKYIRVKVTVEDNDTNNTEFISNEVQIQKLDLVTLFSQSDTIDEDNNYTFDLSSIIDTNYDVSFNVKTDDSNGTSVIDTNKLITFTPNDHYYGSSSIIVTASTETSITSINQDITFNITINSINDAPIFNDGSFSTDEDVTTTFDLSTLTSDEENDSLTYTIVTPPNKGTASIDGSVLTFVPTLNLNGSDSIEVSVSDGNLSNTSTISITINSINDAPVFNDGSFSTDEDVTTTFDLSSLTSDVDSNSLTYTIITPPTKGTASIDGSVLTFAPTLNLYGSDSIEVSVSDGNLSSTCTISITINSINDAPTFNDGSFSTDEDVTTTYDLSTLTSDVENDSLTYTIITPPSKGSASIDGSTLTFVPTLNLNGSDSIEVSVSDGNLSSTSIISVTINAINDPPTINNGSFSANEAEAKQFDLLTLNAIDVDSNSLTYIIKTQPSKGTVSINDTTLTYTSSENEYGSDSFVITVSDGELSADSTIDVLINAVPKILNNFDDLRIEENSDDYIIDLSDKFNDADNSELSYTSISNDTNLINTSILTTDNTQLGDDIIGKKSVLNSDGTKLIYNDTNDRVIKILKYENENWIQMGSNIEFNTNEFSISHIGNRVAIRINNLDIIKIYDYTNDWNEILQIDNVELNGEMSFSPDDNWILVGNASYNNYTGELIIYRCDLNYTLSDNDMRGDNIYDFWGAVSDISNSNIGLYTIAGGATGETGFVKIFYYDHSEEWYYQMGSTLNNENTFDGFGLSVSLSNDGSIIAVGAPGQDDEISSNDPLSKGYVKIYEYINNEWSLKGQKLEGENLGDFFGQIVKLSSDGLKLAVTLNNQVNIYEYVNDTWIKINYIDYENILSISLSENADILNVSTNSEIKTFSLNESGSPRLKLSLLPNSKGETTINITATDGDASVTNSFNVVVFRENEVPVFDSTPVSVAYEDLLYEYNIQVSDVNIEDSNLTIEVVEKPDWLSFVDNQDKTALLSGTPLVSHIGNHNVVLKVTDTVLESTTQSFTITVIEVNDNPIFQSIPITEVDEKSEYLYNIVVSDEENDNVTITTDSALLPSWLTFTQIDKDNAILQGTPTKFHSGDYNIIITATDEYGKSNSQVFTITVNNVNFVPIVTSTPTLNTLRDNLYNYLIIVDYDGTVNISAKNIPTWASLVDNGNNTATLEGTPDENETFDVEIIITEVGGLRTVVNHNFSIKVDSEPYVKNTISDISILTFDNFVYQLPEFINMSSVENKVSYKKSNLVSYNNWIFFDDNFNTQLGETLSYELFIDNTLFDTYDWITFTNGIISINAKYHNIGTYVFKIKVTDVMGNSAETEFNVNVSTSLIRFEKQFYNNNKDALVELDSVDSTEGINLAHNYLETHNFSQEKYNVIIFNSDENKVKIFEGDNNNHTISDHDFIDTFIISKYLDNVRRTKQSIVIKPNKNVNIELK